MTDNVTVLKRTLEHGTEHKKCILALTTRRLTGWNLNYFINQVLDFNLGGLFIWDMGIKKINIIK